MLDMLVYQRVESLTKKILESAGTTFFMFIPSLVCPSEFRYHLKWQNLMVVQYLFHHVWWQFLGIFQFSEKSLSIMLVGHISHIPITLPIISTCFDSDSPHYIMWYPHVPVDSSASSIEKFYPYWPSHWSTTPHEISTVNCSYWLIMTFSTSVLPLSHRRPGQGQAAQRSSHVLLQSVRCCTLLYAQMMHPAKMVCCHNTCNFQMTSLRKRSSILPSKTGGSRKWTIVLFEWKLWYARHFQHHDLANLYQFGGGDWYLHV